MEKSVGSICTKIDAVLAKLETMEKGRNKRKQAMSKILGHMTTDDVDDASKRQEVEALVRKELDHWDSSRPAGRYSALPIRCSGGTPKAIGAGARVSA